MPTLIEALYYSAVSFTLIAVYQYQNILRWLTGEELSEIELSQAITDAFSSRLDDFFDLLDSSQITGSLTISLFWAGLGVVAYLLVNFFSRFFIEAESDLLSEARYVHPKDYNHSYFWVLFVARIMFRVAMIIALAVYTLVTLQVLLPMWLQVIEAWLLAPGDFMGAINALISFVGLGFTWHGFAVITRLIFMKSRVFSKA